MATAQLDISNIVTISVATPPAGLSDFAVNNLAIFTKEVPVNSPGAYGVYLSPTAVLADWGAGSEVYAMANLIFGQTPNILDGGGSLIVYQMQVGDTLANDIPILAAQIFFEGILWAGYTPNDGEVENAAAVCEPIRKLLFASSYLTTSLNSGGLFYVLNGLSYKQTRKLLYTVSAQAARYMAAAYAGRSMSVDFSGSLTTLNMQLKDLVGVLPDPGITQTIYNTCQTLGVDIYANMAGVPKVISFSGASGFFDQIYNLNWFVFALEVAGFNALATVSTKLPQTEPGMAVLRGAYISVLTQAVQNGYLAPGAWNSPELFGNPDDLKRNVLQLGWYLYSIPVNKQSQTQRAQRKAPLCQIAAKEAGAINTTSIVVSINA